MTIEEMAENAYNSWERRRHFSSGYTGGTQHVRTGSVEEGDAVLHVGTVLEGAAVEIAVVSMVPESGPADVEKRMNVIAVVAQLDTRRPGCRK